MAEQTKFGREVKYYIKIGKSWYRVAMGAPTYGGKAVLWAWSENHPERDSRIIESLNRQLEEYERCKPCLGN